MYLITVESDNAEDDTSSEGIRHEECRERTDCFYPRAILFTIAPEDVNHSERDKSHWHGYECWGCDGWLNEPPLSLEQTAERHRLAEEDTYGGRANSG